MRGKPILQATNTPYFRALCVGSKFINNPLAESFPISVPLLNMLRANSCSRCTLFNGLMPILFSLVLED